MKLQNSKRQTPGLLLILLLVIFVSLLQLPANFIIKSLSLSGGILINEMVVLAGLPVLAALIFKFDLSALFPFKTPKIFQFLTAIILAVSVAIIIDYLTAAGEHFFPPPPEYHTALNNLMEFKKISGFVFKLFLLCIIPGICEEIFFRGFCQTSLEKKWGPKTAIFVTAVIFAILHGNPWYLHLYIILGLFLSLVYALTKTLWIPIVCHIANNGWTFITHTLGIKFPIKETLGLPDTALITVSVILSIVLILKLRRI